MSLEGSGVAVAAVGVTAGGAALLAAGAVVGLGVLAYQGIMWCGKKMEENEQRALDAYINLRQAAHAESLANVEDVPIYLARQAEQIAFASANLALDVMPTTPTQTKAAQKQIEESLTRVRSALENAREATHMKAATERELLASRLRAEIEAARGLLPVETITRAEVTLQGSATELHAALLLLQSAWQAITDTQAISLYQERQARQLLRTVAAQLAAVEAMLPNASRAQLQSYTEQKQAIEASIKHAYSVIGTNISGALSIAEKVRQTVRELTRAVSTDTFNQWEQSRTRIITLQGSLETLMSIMQEARAIQLVEESPRTQELTHRLAAMRDDTQALLRSASAATPQQLTSLEERVKLLKRDVLREVKSRQQRQIATTVATTLGELGFQAEVGGQPTLQSSGKVVRVVALRSAETPGKSRDDKMVSFDITRDGDVSYDFSGYTGNTCVSEAKEIFSALRAKGLFILESDAMEKLTRIPAEKLTVEMVNRERYSPHFVRNKAQAELAERLRGIFANMNFANVQESVIGGCIDFEAFNGPIGYHVILPPEGSAQVFKNHTDITSNKQDQIVDELSRIAEELPHKVEEEKQERARETRQDFMRTRQQKLEH